MFLHLFNDAQQKAFLALARQFIDSDRKLAEGEKNLLELMYAEMGQDFNAELPQGDLASLSQAFDSRQARAAALLELIGVGHADDDFSPEENAFVRQVAQRLGISEGEVDEMDRWVERQLALAQEVEGFWRDERAAA